jgi:Ca2+-binding EF-hand superfamily protein
LYLLPFNDIFKHIDKDQNGILNYQELKQLINLMEFRDQATQACHVLNELSVQKLILLIDPYGHKQMTYG